MNAQRMMGAMVCARVAVVISAGAVCLVVLALYLLRPDAAVEVRDSPSSTESIDEPLAVWSSHDVRADDTLEERSNGNVEEQPQAQTPGLPAPPAQALQTLESILQRPPAPELLATERAFVAEAIDPLWSPGMEADIYREIAQLEDLVIVALQVECRMSMCRLQLTQRVRLEGEQTATAVHEVYTTLFAKLGLAHQPVVLAIDRYGTATSMVYFQRHDVAAADADVR